MTNEHDRRRDLGGFLRARRERLTPDDAGIHGVGRRRTPGLRREEVALLAGLSPTWYTWIEQGRRVSASPRALARVADALHLTASERGYLFELAEKRDPTGNDTAPDESPPSALLAALEGMTVPAYLLDRAWCACGWNGAAETLLSDWLGGREKNLLRYVFLEPSARTFISDWHERARRLVAEFRADTSRLREDEEIAALIRELKAASSTFARLWDDRAVIEREGGVRAFQHPVRGRLRYEQLTLRPSSAPLWKLVMLLPLERSVS